MLLFDLIEQRSSELWRRYGKLVARRPLPFLLSPLILTAGLACGLFFSMKVIIDVDELFTPFNGPSRLEAAAFRNVTEASSRRFFIDAIVLRKDRASLLQLNATNHVIDVYENIYRNLSYREDRGKGGGQGISGETGGFSLADLCEQNSCQKSVTLLKIFRDSYYDPVLRNSRSVRFGYPVAEIAGKPINFGFIMGNVSYHDGNSSSTIEGATIIHLSTALKIPQNSSSTDLVMRKIGQYGEVFRNHFENLEDDTYEYFVLYTGELDKELAMISTQTLPFFGLSIILLTVFTICSSLTDRWSSSKPLEAAAGVLNPFLAIVSGIGIVNICSNKHGWNGVLTAMPFLIFAIGVDDMFVFLSSWRKTPEKFTVEQRLGEVMAEAGLSVLVTSVTNIIAFACGIFQPVFAVQHFGIYASVALCFEYIYQNTFFVAVLAYGGRREAEKRTLCLDRCANDVSNDSVHAQNAVLQKFSQSDSSSTNSAHAYNGVLPKLSQSASSIPVAVMKDATHCCNGIFGNLLPLLIMTSVVRIMAVILFLVYLCAAVYGCSITIASITTDKIFIDGTKVQKYVQLVDRISGDQCLEGTVVVTNPPNFNDRSERRSFNQFVREINSVPEFSVGGKSMEIWLNDYKDYLELTDYDNFYQGLEPFLSWKSFSHWRDSLKLRTHGNQTALDAFTFKCYYRNAASFDKRVEVVQAWRRICARYPQIGAYVYHWDSQFVDQVISMPDNVMQDTGVAILSIVGVSLILVHDLQQLFWVTYFLLTIEAGVIGTLKYLINADFDTVSMITLTLSVGLSVDYLLHVAFCFHRAASKTIIDQSQTSTTKLSSQSQTSMKYSSQWQEARIRSALSLIGWPVVQACVSSTLGVIGLAFIGAYVVRLFFATVVTVVVLGLLHCLLFLPIALTAFDIH